MGSVRRVLRNIVLRLRIVVFISKGHAKTAPAYFSPSIGESDEPTSLPAFFQYLFLGCAAILAFGPSAALRAQDAPSAAAVDAPTPHTAPAPAAQPAPATVPAGPQASQVPASTDGNSTANPDSSPEHHQQSRPLVGSGQGHQSQSTEGIHLSLWDRSPLDALQPGNRALPSRAFGSVGDTSNSGAAFEGANAACLFCGAGQAGGRSSSNGRTRWWRTGSGES